MMKSITLITFLICFNCYANTCDLGSTSAQPEIEKFAKQYIDFSINECPLFNQEEAFDHLQEGLSDFWAQEYTGADLLRNLMKDQEIELNLEVSLFDILDTPSEDHGSHVSSLISGPIESALIPSSQIRQYRDVSRSYASYYSTFTGSGFPPYINNSMTWSAFKDDAKLIGWISNNSKSLIITAAGNDTGPLDLKKVEAADNLNVLVVGSVAQSGEPSNFSQFSDRVIISAPSDNFLLSAKKDGSFSIFGGTSGATPQVTASLVAFTLITGHNLNKSEAIKLLETTAQRGSENFNGKHGTGILNTYKIGRVAFKIKEGCKTRVGEDNSKCIKQKLDELDTYSFPKQDLSMAKKAFSNCFHGEKQSEVNCTERQLYFRMIREEALLNPEKDILRSLACISKSQGYTQNANFYEYLSSNL